MSLGPTIAALSDLNRQKILDLLREREMSVTEIAAHFQVTMPTLSHHLDVLKKTGLVSGRRSGQQILYSLNLSVVEEMVSGFVSFFAQKKTKKNARRRPGSDPKL
jgi:ArsR family transcriptional regulator, arsenate/arsenite/antimonite-responsive transcriptional repressor